MKKSKIIVFILGFILFNPIVYIVSSTKDNTSECTNTELKLFQFNSYIQLDIDTTVLDDPVSLGQAISVPIDIVYFTDIPLRFLVVFTLANSKSDYVWDNICTNAYNTPFHH